MSLQKFALACIFGAFSLLVHMSAYAQARTLEEVMALMGRSLGAISRPVNQGTAGPAEAQQAHQLLLLVEEGKSILPTSVTSLPADQQVVRAQLYVDLMTELAVAISELETSITLRDVARAKAAMQSILKLRTRGHEEFRI